MKAFPDRKPVCLAEYQTKAGSNRTVPGIFIRDINEHGHSLIIVGKYTNVCGGCDTIKTQDLICGSVRLAAERATHVIFEGVIVSTIFQRYLDLSRELGSKEQPYIWCFLNTNLQTCLKRIQKRNGGKPIKEELVADKMVSIHRVREKAESAGEVIATGATSKELLTWLVKGQSI